jgi:hypothetical protein
MYDRELYLAARLEDQALERRQLADERLARRQARPIRRRLGESVIRLGERLSDDRRSSPALTG